MSVYTYIMSVGKSCKGKAHGTAAEGFGDISGSKAVSRLLLLLLLLLLLQLVLLLASLLNRRC